LRVHQFKARDTLVTVGQFGLKSRYSRILGGELPRYLDLGLRLGALTWASDI